MPDENLEIAIVSHDPGIRLVAARAFDDAPANWHVKLHENVPANADVVVVGPDVDSVKGIPLDPERPGELVAAIKAAGNSPKRGELTVVTSASGGTGATSIALHLATCGDASCLLDLDVVFGCARRLGLPDKHLNWTDVGDSRESLMLAALPIRGGFRALVSPGDGTEPADTDSLLDRTSEAFSNVVVDVPPGRLLPIALARSRAAVLVVRPDLQSAHRSASLLRETPSTRWAVVANRLGPGGETTLNNLAAILGRSITLEVPCSPALRDAEDDCELLASRLWRYRRAILRLYLALERA
jgi:Flp pilus assembly CpaE family ATPase